VGERTLRYAFGPVEVRPGQNRIAFERNDLKPRVEGWITGFRPNLVRADGEVPPTDVIHLHHGVLVGDVSMTVTPGGMPRSRSAGSTTAAALATAPALAPRCRSCAADAG
jgi:hypothetical protein